MERVTFLIEDTGERIGCMLNPESLIVKRLAGVRRLAGINGVAAGPAQSDDLLLFTGGGRTELRFDLLFDISIAGSSIIAKDVRDLTGPLWRLTENVPQSGGRPGPAAVRFIWGKSWNILGVIDAIAERFDRFAPDGRPQRSWLSLRFVRINEAAQKSSEPQSDLAFLQSLIDEGGHELPQWIAEKAGLFSSLVHEGASLMSRLDLTAFERFGSAAYWRVIAAANNLSNIFDISVEFSFRLEIGGGRTSNE